MRYEINALRTDEIEINVENIIKQCVKRMGLIIACGVICGLLLASLVYVTDVQSHKGEGENQEEVVLSASEYAGIAKYKNLQNRVEQLCNYGENAMVMKLDFENVYQGKMQFYVDTKEEAQVDMAFAIVNYVNSYAATDKICESLGIPSDAYGGELFGAEVSGVLTGVPTGVVNFRVWAADEATCKSYMEAVTTVIKEYSRTLQSTMGSHTLSVIAEDIVVGYSAEVELKQTTHSDKLNTAISAYTTQEASLTDLQHKVIAMQQDPDYKGEPVVHTFSMKYVVLGGILGVVAAVGVIALMVLFGGKLQTRQELLRRFNISNFGALGKKDKEYEAEMAATRVASFLEKSGKKQVAFITSLPEMPEDVNPVLAMLKEKNVQATILGNVLRDPVALDGLKNLDTIVLIEKIGKTNVKEVYEESSVCLDAQADVIGYITILE